NHGPGIRYPPCGEKWFRSAITGKRGAGPSAASQESAARHGRRILNSWCSPKLFLFADWITFITSILG
ncbi:MAG TPA: hypothetical protein VKV15_10310, partial [Bryobacteraceae bacterium]|nr:hypothetical protein [Bryobacteraceae bacterium]